MIYLDSSALMKLVFEEAESAPLESWIVGLADTPVVTSELARIEVSRAARRIDPGAGPAARDVLAGLDFLPMTGDVVGVAGEIGEPLLRSLDAIHLAAAWSLRDHLEAFVAYDDRLVSAARDAGLSVLQPGT